MIRPHAPIARYLHCALMACLLACVPAAFAQGAGSYPDRAIKFVLPFPAGSGTDSSARFVGQGILEATKQAVVVENRPGADGIIAAQAVARAPADGYTVFVTTMTTQSVNPHLYKKLPYDPVKDFAPVSLFTRSPMMLVVRNEPDQPKTLDELTAYARKRTVPLAYATGNTSSRVAAEFYSRKVGIKVTRVPYRGTPQGLTDLLAGQVDFMFVDLSPVVPLVKAGKLRGLAVTSTERLASLPDIATTAELGMPDLQLYTWAGAFVPAATPKAVIDRLSELMQKTLRTKEALEYFGKNGVEPAPMTPEQLGAFVKTEYETWGRAVRMAEIPAE
ncbi:tripartite tricarboxylate transporter substrate binding protein [soil metagenome]